MFAQRRILANASRRSLGSLASGTVTRAQHASRVRTVYRRILKNHLNWCIQRERFYILAEHTRAEFDKAGRITNEDEMDRHLAMAEAYLESHEHPDPYIIPDLPGGTKYQRNAPVPIEVLDMHAVPPPSK